MNGSEPPGWLPKSILDQEFTSYKTVWDLYLKFYTVFLTVNFVALAAVVQHIKDEGRGIIVVAFLLQNLFSFGTALTIAFFSKKTAERYNNLCFHLASQSKYSDVILESAKSSVPGWIGYWGGIANAASHIALMACWIAVIYKDLCTNVLKAYCA